MMLSSHTVYGIVVISVVIFGVCGNLIVFCTYARTSRLRKQHFFTLNLSLMALCLSVFYILPAAYHFLHIRMDGLACNAYAFIAGVLAIGTIHQLAVISIERCLLIARPFSNRSARMRHRLFAVVGVYVTAAISVLPPLIGWSRFLPAEHEWYCGFDYESRTWEARSFLLYLFFMAYAAPLAVIVFAYSTMIVLLRSNRANLPNGHRPRVESFSSQLSSTSRSSELKRQIQVAKLMFLVITVFVVSWTPYAIITFSYNFILELPYSQLAVQTSAIFAKMFVVFTPIVFGLRDHQLREFLTLLLTRFSQRRESRTVYCFRSYAYLTTKDRWPKILAKIVDTTHRQRHNLFAKYGEEGDNDVKAAVHELSELRYLLTTDKPLQLLEDKHEDVDIYNNSLKELQKSMPSGQELSWFKSPWLYTECHLYRRIFGTFMKSRHLKSFDPFSFQKETAFVSSLKFMTIIGDHLREEIENDKSFLPEQRKNTVEKLLQIALWGNKCDLSATGGDNHESEAHPLEQVDELRDYILVNDLEAAYNVLERMEGQKRVDIVLDNAGLELFDDLCLAEYLINSNFAKKVVFHGKAMPWFVSDTTANDFVWTTELLRSSQEKSLAEFGHKWNERMECGEFVFQAHPFWTYPFAYCEMEKYAPDLLADLSQSSFIILKGDLNYRKLVGDRDWPLDTPFLDALRGFLPAPLLALRTLKAETVAGLSQDTIARLAAKFPDNNKDWMVTGEYAVVQLCMSSK
uniref:Damage-control phosphatase ARMT1 n=1 Tax=Plectus sambesii TaxID=2011161 RepID=A0A914VE78_9BILA